MARLGYDKRRKPRAERRFGRPEAMSVSPPPSSSSGRAAHDGRAGLKPGPPCRLSYCCPAGVPPPRLVTGPTSSPVSLALVHCAIWVSVWVMPLLPGPTMVVPQSLYLSAEAGPAVAPSIANANNRAPITPTTERILIVLTTRFLGLGPV